MEKKPEIIANKKRKKYNIFQKSYRALKYHLLMITLKNDSANSIAHGLAIGIFIGFMPIIPLQAIAAIVVCGLTKTNKIAGVVGTNIFTSAFTAAPVFYLVHFIGKIFIDVDITYTKFKELFTKFSITNIVEFGLEIYLAVIIGGLVMAIIFYPIVYFYTKKAVINFRLRREERRKKNRKEKTENNDLKS